MRSWLAHSSYIEGQDGRLHTSYERSYHYCVSRQGSSLRLRPDGRSNRKPGYCDQVQSMRGVCRDRPAFPARTIEGIRRDVVLLERSFQKLSSCHRTVPRCSNRAPPSETSIARRVQADKAGRPPLSQEEKIELSPEDRLELERLRALEAASDPASQRFILSTGLARGWRCLEVGAGAGSLLSWMASVVGSTGRTIAIDLNTRYLSNPPSGAQVINGDIRTESVESDWSDLVHARYVRFICPTMNSLSPGC